MSSPPEGSPTAVQHMPIIYGTISQSETKSHNVLVDPTILEINFLLGWNGGDIGFILTAPDGTLITPTSSVGSVTYFNEAQIGVAGYTIQNPLAGTWTVNVKANNVSDVGTYSVEILAESTLICSLETDKNVYDPNQPVRITAMLANNNIPLISASVTASVITPSITENILLYDDGTNGDIVANDGTYTNTYSNTNMSGNYYLSATAIGNINNQPFVRQANAIIWVEQFPDLTIATSSITFSNNTPGQNEQVTINATINNIGDIAATNTTIFFYDGLPLESGTLFGTATIGNIPKGGNAVASANWKATYGSHTIYIAISPYNSFLEKDYNNNSAARQIVVTCAELTLSSTDISFIPTCPNSGEMATITAIVYNTGTTKADNVIVGFFIGNPLGTGTGIGSQTITTIPANGSKTIQIAWNTAGYVGIIPIYLQIDPQNKIPEADEDNNIAYKDMYVQGADTSSPTISITNPSSQQTLSGFVDIIATANDNVGVTKVEFFIDNVLKASDITEPYSYSWDTTKESNNSHAIKAIAYDPSGLTGIASIVATVDNSAPLESIPPTFSIAVSPDPANAGSVSIFVSASEKLKSVPNIVVKDSNNGIIATELVIDNNPAFRYQATITSSTSQGTATVNISGTDLAGNIGSVSTTFQVKTIETPIASVLGTLSVVSFPTGASILIDGVNKGTTPSELSLQSGSYTLSLALPDYLTCTTTVTIGTGSITNISATLTAVTISTHLRITPSTKNIIKGEGFTIGVEITGAKEIITGSLYLSFNPDILELQEIGTGTFPGEGNVMKRYDNTTGKIDYFVGLLIGSATGSGIICTLKFKAKTNGSSSVTFDFDEPNNRMTRLKNIDGNNISFNKEEAAYYVFTGITSIKIKPQDAMARADEDIAYQCIATCDNGLEIDITGSTTFTAIGGGTFTQNVFLAKYRGTHTVQGEYAGLIGTATVVILPGTPSAIAYVSGNEQVATCSSTLKEPFVVKVVDKYNNPCDDMKIKWEIISSPLGAAGLLSATMTTTDILGIASSTLTLGPEPPGTYTICAILPGLIDLSYTFTARSLRMSGNIAGFCLFDLGNGRLGTASQIQISITETGATATTNESSYFIFNDIPVGTYSLKFDSRGAGSRVVSNVRISQTQFNATTHIGSITLLAGDINNDGRINLVDWPGFADAFFKQERDAKWEEAKQADFNHDGKVNDEDFIVIRNNFGKQTEGMVMNAPSLSKSANSGSNVELSLDRVDVNELRVGNIIYLKVHIRNAKDLLGAEVHLSFDPKMLEVVNVPVSQSRGMNVKRFSAPDALRIQDGDYFTTDVWELMNRVDNTTGKIDYSVGVLKPEINNEGILAIVPLRIKSAGASSIVDFDFKEQENRQTFLIERRHDVEGKPIDTIPDIQSEGIEINILQVMVPSDIRVYPNPVTGKDNEVIFASLPTGKQVTLRIYNLAGELVFVKSGMNEIRWGLRNEDGEAVASGIYIYSLRDESGVIRQGKIGVIR